MFPFYLELIIEKKWNRPVSPLGKEFSWYKHVKFQSVKSELYIRQTPWT